MNFLYARCQLFCFQTVCSEVTSQKAHTYTHTNTHITGIASLCGHLHKHMVLISMNNLSQTSILTNSLLTCVRSPLFPDSFPFCWSCFLLIHLDPSLSTHVFPKLTACTQLLLLRASQLCSQQHHRLCKSLLPKRSLLHPFNYP